MRESDEPLTDTLVRCLADPTDLKALERLVCFSKLASAL